MRWVILVLVVLLVGAIAFTIPDVRRYVRLKRM
jgi:hypothetical protein